MAERRLKAQVWASRYYESDRSDRHEIKCEGKTFKLSAARIRTIAATNDPIFLMTYRRACIDLVDQWDHPNFCWIGQI